MGQLYLSNIDFLKNGIPASIMATLVSFFVFRLPRSVLMYRVGRCDGRIPSHASDWVRMFVSPPSNLLTGNIVIRL